jgi:hypothetical protein
MKYNTRFDHDTKGIFPQVKIATTKSIQFA